MPARPHQYRPEPSPKEDFDGWVKARSYNWRQELSAVFGPPEEGRNRATFLGQTHVLKVPLNDCGLIDNEHEGSLSKGIYARSEILHDADGFPLLRMEKVIRVPVEWWPSLPLWTFAVDCCQVGYSKIDGRLVAYDFGCQ